jgi:putative ABC transport system permease protein
MLRELWNEVRYRVRALTRRAAAERSLRAEIDDHIAREAEALERAGLSPAEARRRARLAFGALEQIKDESRDAWGTTLVTSAIQDVRYGARQLRRHPTFAASGILILGLGIAATTVIFSIAHSVLFRALPYEQSDRLVTLGSSLRPNGFQSAYAGLADYFDWRQRQDVFEDLGLTRPVANYNLTGSGEPERLQGARTTASVFSTLRARPLLGRTYSEAEQLDPARASRVAELSYGLWQRRFGSDAAIVGRTILLNSTPTEVIGVMGPEFQYPDRTFELWTPLYVPPGAMTGRTDISYLSVARLKAGVTLEAARAHMRVVAANLEREFPRTNTGVRVFVDPMLDSMTGPVRRPLFVLVAAVGVLFLAGCVNLTNLVIARAANRAQELSLRASLGATRSRLARQFFAEALPLAGMGAVLGIVGAQFLLRLLVPLLPATMPRISEIGVHGPVLGAAVLLSAVAALGIALAPAMQVRSNVARGPASRGRVRDLLIVTEISCTVLLLVTAGLLIKSFWQLRATDPGFRPAGVLSLHLAVNRSKHGDDLGVARYLGRLIERVRGVPGVDAVGIVNRLPLGGQVQAGPIQIDGYDARVQTDWRSASADYFRALDIPILAGRTFHTHDSANRPPEGLIDVELARQVFGSDNPIGKRFRIDAPDSPWVEIVGIVGHIRHDGLDRDSRPQVYWPYDQRTQDRMAMVVKATVDPASLVSAVRAAVYEIDPEQPLYDVRPMTTVVEGTLRGEWLTTVMVGAFGLMALTLAGAGLYGVIAYLTTERRLEFGIRLALGATTSDVLALVLKQGLGRALAGLALGLALAAAATRALGSMLHGVSAWDPLIYTTVSGLLIVVVLAASLVPAWGASRLDPRSAIQQGCTRARPRCGHYSIG